MQAKYETMGKYRKLLGQCLFRLYVIGSFASFFIIAEQKNHSKEQPLIERLQEIRAGEYNGRTVSFRLPDKRRGTLSDGTGAREVLANSRSPV